MFGWIIAVIVIYLIVSFIVFFRGLSIAADARNDYKDLKKYPSLYKGTEPLIYRKAKSAQFVISHSFIWPILIAKTMTGKNSWAAEYIREYELAEARKVIDNYERRTKVGGY